MKSITSTPNSYKQTQMVAPSAAWSELCAATPMGIVYHAVRELLRQRNHKRLVLEAFKR